MNISDPVHFFFQQRWPNGFACPRCGYSGFYTITTRTLPLYQCRLCKHQTTVTAGTVMDRSRTPLAKWAAAIELLASTEGVNAVQLAAAIGVSRKVAWTMLRNIRRAISEADASLRLTGIVRAGLAFLGRWNIHPFILNPQQHVVIAGASFDSRTGEPAIIKFRQVAPPHLSEIKRLTREGEASFLANHVHPEAMDVQMLKRKDMHLQSPIRQHFDQAAKWLNRLFHGLGASYLQLYLDEYCFRWNLAASGRVAREEWFNVCLSRAAG